MNRLGIQDQLQSARNQAFAQVAIAPTQPLEIPEPVQHAGPSSAGMMLGIGNAALSGISSIAGNMAPNPGTLPGGGGGMLPSFNTMNNYSVPTPLTSGMNFFQGG